MGGGPYYSPDPLVHPSHVAAWCSDAWRLAHNDVDRGGEYFTEGLCAHQHYQRDGHITNLIPPKWRSYYWPYTKMYRYISLTNCCCMVLWSLKSRLHWCGQDRRMSWWRAFCALLPWGEGPITHLMPRSMYYTCRCMVLWCLKACPHLCWQDRRMSWWRDLWCSAAMGKTQLLTWCPDVCPSHVTAWCCHAWRVANLMWTLPENVLVFLCSTT